MKTVSVRDFAKKIYRINKSDRDVNLAVAGFTGEGKSCFSTQCQKAYAKIAGTYWGFDRMTWSREEMLTWIDGEKGGEVDPETGLKKGQLPEYSAILPDELFPMFYSRNWYEDKQKAAIETFNMCRDRHLFVAGNVPNFWELDSGMLSRIRFYAYIPRRGVAWIFEQENNPFAKDNWNRRENKKKFRKYKNPSRCPNFLFAVEFPDWSADEKEEYYRIRNEKRVEAVSQNKTEKVERYADIKRQRDLALRFWKDSDDDISYKEMSEVVGLSPSAVRKVIVGER